MNDNVIEILNYIFKKCAREDVLLPSIQEETFDRLRLNGVSEASIMQALMWLVSLNQQPHLINISANSASFRVFDERELSKIGKDGCDFIMFVERNFILNAKTRETVINQLMLLPQATCELMEVKWVVLMVLISCADKIDGDVKLRCFTLFAGDGVSC